VRQIFSCVSHGSGVAFSTDELIRTKDLTCVSAEDTPGIGRPAYIPSCFSHTPINISGRRNFICVVGAKVRKKTTENPILTTPVQN